MSATIHGGSELYSLVEQPGSSFTTTRAGFDTGRRTFKCWQSVAGTLEPRRGTPDTTYPGMIVDTVTTTFDTAGVAKMDVNYLGIKDEGTLKEDDWAYSVNLAISDRTIEATIGATAVTLGDTQFVPQITRTYITAALPTNKVGDFVEPAKFADLVPSTSVSLPGASVQLNYLPYFTGWRLEGRTIKQAGPRYEISETMNYVAPAIVNAV